MIIASIANTKCYDNCQYPLMPSFGLLQGPVMMLFLHWAYGHAPGMYGNVFPLKTLVGLRLSLGKDLVCMSFPAGMQNVVQIETYY